MYLRGIAFLLLLIGLACESPSSSSSSPTMVEGAKDSTQQVSLKVAQPMIDTTIQLSELMGKFDPTKHPGFVKIGAPYAENSGMYLRKATYEAFKKMHAAAKADGVDLLIRSATRNFARQKVIWEGKWKGTRKLEGGVDASKKFPDPKDRAQEILKWSSMPGSSRHHWGTDIDLNAFVNSYFAQGKGLKEYQWLTDHAADFGFCRPYTAKGKARPYGYNEEKWHWSYTPISLPFTEQCELRLQDEMIMGFLGSETAQSIGIVEKYVLGINKACR